MRVALVCVLAVFILAISVVVVDASKPAEVSMLFVATYLASRPFGLFVSIATQRGTSAYTK